MKKTKKETFIYCEKPFLTAPVRTEPYVWHLTDKRHRLDIAFGGILPIRGLAFANNMNEKIGHMWHWSTEMEAYDGSGLDYWRIDVRRAGVRWYNDINLDYGKAWGKYVCTPSPIPVDAIALFRHDTSLRFLPSRYEEDGSERVPETMAWAVKELKSDFQKLMVKKMEGVANCSLKCLPLKRVDPFELLAKDHALDKVNENLALQILPTLFEAQPEQTLSAIMSPNFETFYETLFNNRKPVESKEDWKGFFNAIRVNSSYCKHLAYKSGRAYQVSWINNLTESSAIFDIYMTTPTEACPAFRLFRMEMVDKHSFLMKEYVDGTYQERTNLVFSTGMFTNHELDRFLLENLKPPRS